MGSWHGGWAWEPTAWCLREFGHTAYAPTYPAIWPGVSRVGVTHDDYVAAVARFITQRDLRNVILVGHSFGGSVVSRVSQLIPERLKRLVFHTAFVVAVVRRSPAARCRPTMRTSPGWMRSLRP